LWIFSKYRLLYQKILKLIPNYTLWPSYHDTKGAAIAKLFVKSFDSERYLCKYFYKL
jgi:hypothetical protein